MWTRQLARANMFLSTIETDVSSREEEGDHVGEDPGVGHYRPEQRDGEDDQGRAEVESVHIAETQHQTWEGNY